MIRRRMMIARSHGKKTLESSSETVEQRVVQPSESIIEVVVEATKNEVAEEPTKPVDSSAKKKTNLKKDMLSSRAP